VARRSVWLVTGVVAGAASSLYAERKLKRSLEAASARLQPDALVAEVGRTARQAASNTGGRVRAAVASAREEKQRREDELWAELSTADDGAPGDVPGDDAAPGPDGAATGDPNGAPAATPRPGPHASYRRIRRITRRSPSHLGK
jgi:hypothetical protein